MGTSPEIIDLYILASYNCFSRQINIGNIGNSGFGKGVLALSVSQSKGFEFEAVPLWKPDLKGDNNNSKLAELL